MSGKNIHLINTSSGTTAFGRYARDVAEVMPEAVSVSSFIVKKSDIHANFPGKSYRGYYPPFPGRRAPGDYFAVYLNSRFFRIAFRKGIADLTRGLQSGDIIHYASQEVYPFHNEGNEIVTIHDLVALSDKFGSGSFASRAYRRLVVRNLEKYRKFSRIIAVSDHVRKELVVHGFGGRIEVIHSRVSPSFAPLGDRMAARDALGLPRDKKLILSVSINHTRKNLETVRETVERLGNDFRLVRVGTGIGDSINFSDVSDDRLNLIYNSCDVLLFPSLEEGFGFPAVEAFACGLPVVASDIDVMREICRSAAVLVSPDPDGCRRGVIDALSRREELSAAGLGRAREFSTTAFSTRMRNYYSSL